MNLDSLLKETGEWLKGTGANADVVISSRIRLARNVSDIPFPHRASKDQKKKVVSAVLESTGKCLSFKNSLTLSMKEMDLVDRQFLAERHLISLEFVESGENAGVIISEKEIISVMINEEDHLRIQAIRSGLQLMDAWHLIDGVDTCLSKDIKFAYSPEWGYLTACPTNAGTGMRASLMLHLPGLVISKQIDKIIQAIVKLGMAARGLHGEGTKPFGNFFQISNQITLGRSEEDIIDNIERIGKQVVGHEEKARKLLLNKHRMELEDRIFRAYGILKNVRIISSAETLDLLSSLRLGIDLGFIGDVDHKTVNNLLVPIQPAHLQKIEGRLLSHEERDVKRADLIRKTIRSNLP
jgi:protein arginine kinase